MLLQMLFLFLTKLQVMFTIRCTTFPPQETKGHSFSFCYKFKLHCKVDNKHVKTKLTENYITFYPRIKKFQFSYFWVYGNAKCFGIHATFPKTLVSIVFFVSLPVSKWRSFKDFGKKVKFKKWLYFKSYDCNSKCFRIYMNVSKTLVSTLVSVSLPVCKWRSFSNFEKKSKNPYFLFLIVRL